MHPRIRSDAGGSEFTYLPLGRVGKVAVSGRRAATTRGRSEGAGTTMVRMNLPMSLRRTCEEGDAADLSISGFRTGLSGRPGVLCDSMSTSRNVRTFSVYVAFSPGRVKWPSSNAVEVVTAPSPSV